MIMSAVIVTLTAAYIVCLGFLIANHYELDETKLELEQLKEYCNASVTSLH